IRHFHLTSRVLKSPTLSNESSLSKILSSWSPAVPVEQALTLPSIFYTNNDIFELEKQTVFGQNWLAVGHVSQLKKPGDFISGQFLSEPYIVNVDETGKIRSHYNVCCHHGMCLTTKLNGNVNEFQCPYHGWIYDLNGRLKKALRLKNIQNFKASKTTLKPIDVRIIGPFVYLNLNFSNREQEIDLSHIESVHENYLKLTNYDELEFLHTRTYSLKCNWKVFIDNFLDGGYHVNVAHKWLAAYLNMKDYRTIVNNKYSAQTCYGTNEKRLEGNVCYVFLYPNFAINRYGSFMDTNSVIPIDKRNCLVKIDHYLDKSVDRITHKNFIDKSLKDSYIVQDEDVFLCENVQIGLESNAYDSGRYVPTVEHAMHDFHKILYKEINDFYQHLILER
ncbi:unnamed protein product, partial [Didymodactylos carnosus]